MNALRQLSDTVYISWTIGAKDILETLKNRSTRVNIILMLLMVVFFYWLGTWRPFDKNVSVVVYDQGGSGLNLERVTLGDGALYSFQKADSLQDMEKKMAHKDLGLVIPSGFDPAETAGSPPPLEGYIFWAQRMQVTELETKYSQAFSEIIGLPVQVRIGQNIVVPQPNIGGMHATNAYQLLFFVFWTAIALLPHLMLEERRNRTIDALLVSPASPGQVILGKAIAGFFYILLVGGLAIVLDRAYVTHWWLAALAFLGYALFAIAISLALGSFIQSQQQLALWGFLVLLVLIIPSLFLMEPNLKAGIQSVIAWLPGSALSTLYRISCSNPIGKVIFWQNLAVACASIAVAFGLVIWQVRRADR